MPNNLEAIHSLPDLREEHKDDFWLNNAGDRVDRVLSKWKGEQFTGDWRILKGARILDLGCGTALPDSCHVYEPYFCQIAALNGAEAYGVDLFEALSEDTRVFTHIQADFVDAVRKGKLRNLFPLQNPSFDVIHLWRLTGTGDPFMIKSLKRFELSVGDFFRLLVPQAHDLLKEGGLLAVEDEFICRNGNGFVNV